jgi:protease-4
MIDVRSQVKDAAAATRKTANKISEQYALRTAPLILELDLTEPLAQGPRADPLVAITQWRRTRVLDVLDGLRKASQDDRVKTLVAKVGLAHMGFARAQELRDAVQAFRAAGKPAVAWAETFGEWGPGTVPYYLATAFDEIWLQPIGDVTFNGLAVGTTFLREAFDKLNIEPEFGQRHEYKNAADVLMRSKYTDAHREAVQQVASSVFDEMISAVAQVRRLSNDQVRELVDRAPISAADALAAGLVDRLGYRDEVYAEVRSRAGDEAHLQYVARYLHPGGPLPRPKLARPEHRLALIWGVGPIVQGRSSGRRPSFGPRMGSDTVAAAFRAAVRDETVQAIVFVVNSPGGSAVASDAIWREVALARKAGKPVIASMGDVAGSGGYYVAMAADSIVAEPSTITGSIGAVSGKLVTDGLWNRLGLTYDSVAFGTTARMFSSRSPYSPVERAALDRWLDRLYDGFVDKVAESRGMSRDDVHAVAKGRIWTGADAKDRGLVDVLGGFHRAVELAKEKAGIPGTAEVKLVDYPRLRPIDRVLPPQSSEDAGAALASGWGSFAGLAAHLGLPVAGPLTMSWTPPLPFSC